MRWRARTIVQQRIRRRACRPQLKRGPLGSPSDLSLVSEHVPLALVLALRIALLLSFAVFGLWTCRRLFRHASSRYEQLVYSYGVKGWGLGMWVAMTIILTHQGAPRSLGDLAFKAGAMMIINLPFTLWGGYMLGRAMAWAFGVEGPNGTGAA